MVADHSGCSTDPDMLLSSIGDHWCPAPSPDLSAQPVLYNRCCVLSLAQLQLMQGMATKQPVFLHL